MSGPTAEDRTARRVAIVTGGARGIGAAIAQRLAADGIDVAVVDLDAATCGDTVRSVEAAGRRAIAVGADVSDEQAVATAVLQVCERLGVPSILVNNAGTLLDRTLGRTTVPDWERMINVNLRGTFLMCRAVQSHMRNAHWGRIVNLSSTGALGGPGLTSYAAAKAGVQGLTKTLAIELGRYGITVNAVAPGFIATMMTAGVAERGGLSFGEMQQQMAREIPAGRVGRPEDVANAVAFFVDERAGYVSGQVLYVAGGPRA